MIPCERKHTTFQPSDEQWKCPKCGGEINLVFNPDEVSSECGLLHTDDWVECNTHECRYSAEPWSAPQLARALKKRHQVGLQVCECCKGTGYVKSSENPTKPDSQLGAYMNKRYGIFDKEGVLVEGGWNSPEAADDYLQREYVNDPEHVQACGWEGLHVSQQGPNGEEIKA